ncbi:MAG: SDR family oxidoreductase [Rhizobium sp.]|nr:SDR family oxidoreductase [Rhizobium sp.]
MVKVMVLKTVFVTGATGLLGNNLVRELVSDGVRVKAAVRDRHKAETQFEGLDGVEIVLGDMSNVPAFAVHLAACDAVMHTAAYFRDSYKGGSHWEELKRINVDGAAALAEAAYKAGVRRFVHVSSIAVLIGQRGRPITEADDRPEKDADDYYRSKILSERAVRQVAVAHPDMHVTYVLPGWMWGPGDAGPTSSGQTLLDIVRGKLPGIPPGSFSIVDARDVARAVILACERGRAGERYLAAGRHMTMADLVPLIGREAEVRVPKTRLPFAILYTLAVVQEAYARVTGKPVLLSLATVKLLAKEDGRSHYDHAKSQRELGLQFRPVQDTIRDTLHWYRNIGQQHAIPVAVSSKVGATR